MKASPLLPAVLFLAGVLSFSPPLRADDEDNSAIEEITVVASRSRQLVRDQAVRVEVVPQEELEESRTAMPGNLTNLLNELAGARMEAPSSLLGGSGLRLRGMPARHGQILADGLPLGGAESSSFSFLQSPPVDLGRVEVIKGVASALYGGSALAGVMNLVSRPPGGESELLLNQTSQGGSDADLFISGADDGSLNYTLTGSAHYQSRRDLDHDGWAELPGYERITARPRFYWRDDSRTVFGTVGFIGENRTGGTTGSNVVPGGAAFQATLDTRRADAGMVMSQRRDGGDIINARWDAVYAQHDRDFGGSRVQDSSAGFLAEANYQGKAGAHEWTLGAEFRYDDLSVPDVAGVSYSYVVPAVFAQDEFSPWRWLSLAGSARVDAHSEFGTFVSPRASALFRLSPEVSLRASAGAGYAPATPLVDEIEEIGFAPLEPLGDLSAERGSSASLDLKWRVGLFDINVSAFSSEVRHALDAEVGDAPDRVKIVNQQAPFRADGAELLVGLIVEDLHLLVNGTYLDASEEAPGGGRRPAALMPEWSGEVAGIFELEGRGRAGVEVSYTGGQPLHDDPYRDSAPSYVEINALAELKFGRIAVFFNAMNVTDVKQQDHGPLLRPAGLPGLGGMPVTDTWAPIQGRYFNLGVRAEL